MTRGRLLQLRAAASAVAALGWRHRRRVALTTLGLSVVVVALTAHAVELNLVTPMPSTALFDRNGEPLAEVEGGDDGGGDGGGEGGRFGYWPLPWVLPMKLSVATRETEDRRFFEHAGVSPTSVLRAAMQNLREGRVVSGASTIAMQVARMQSGRRRSFISKYLESIEALFLVRRFGHDAVLRHYLTLAPYGARIHGAERAARFYFDKPSADVSWLQAAWLAGLPQSPTRLGPFVDGGLARGRARAERTLQALHKRGYLSAAELDVELHSDLGLVDRRPQEFQALHYTLRLKDEVRAARKAGGAHAGMTSLQTSLDLQMQRKVTTIVQKNLESVAGLGATNSAAVVVDTATGEVLAWVGSADYFDEHAHGAIDYARVKRSPGSTLKPFIYALALDPNTPSPITAATPLADIPLEIVDDTGRSYTPKNISGTFLGPMSAREALGNSRNLPALRVLADHVGVERALRFFEAGGVTDVSFVPGHYGLGLALGNMHVTVEELAALYLTLRPSAPGYPLPLWRSPLDGPRPTPPVSGQFAHVDTSTADNVTGGPLLDPGAALVVAQILADPTARQPSFPRGSALDYDTAVSVKTGTSQGFRDGWTVAQTDRLLVAMWVGNHDWRRMNHLGGLAGTADGVHDIIDAVGGSVRRHIPAAMSVADAVGGERREVCALSGMLAGHHCPHRRVEVFLPDTVPGVACEWHQEMNVDVRTGDRATAMCPSTAVRPQVVLALPPTFARWGRQRGLPLAPTRFSRLCGGHDAPTTITLTEPRAGVRYAFDPSTPSAFSTIRLAADVDGSRDEPVVFLVDGEPVSMSHSGPHEARWSLTPGQHTIVAVLANQALSSAPVTITVRP
jgi:penicillin-binding protein 1C